MIGRHNWDHRGPVYLWNHAGTVFFDKKCIWVEFFLQSFIYFIGCFERQREGQSVYVCENESTRMREKERESPFCWSTPKIFNNHGWARSKLSLEFNQSLP